MAKAKNDVIKEAEVEISYFTASEEAQYLADMRDLWESDVNSRLYDAKEERNRRTEKRNGRKEGEKNKQVEIAKKMIERGKDIKEIMELTELSEEEIESLKR